MDIRKIKKLIELLEESGLAEIEITEGEESVRISRYGTSQIVTQLSHAAPQPTGPAAAPAAAPSAPPAALPAPAAPAEKVHAAENVVAAPMVGTFYASAAPGAKPFVDIGSDVKVGQTLCIIEAMKLMNEINAECDGEVVKVYVENGRAVHYGERLFAIRPV